MTTQQLARFFAKVQQVGACWVWTASARDGYGQFNLDGTKPVAAHRAAYQHFIGDPPVGLDLDHLCRNRRCVNPTHLEPVTRSENLRRGATGKHVRTAAHRAAIARGWIQRKANGLASTFSPLAYQRSREARRRKAVA